MRRMDESRREMVMSDGKLVDALWSCSVCGGVSYQRGICDGDNGQ